MMPKLILIFLFICKKKEKEKCSFIHLIFEKQ